MIEIQSVSHRYGNFTAVNNVSLRVSKGELHGLLGPDGAGKTTLLRILTTLIPIQKGEIKISGISVKNYLEARKLIGYMPQRFSLYHDLSVAENLEFFANIYGISPEERLQKEEELYHFSGLAPFKNRPAGKLSGGMKQKLALMCALIHDPQILILDEPTTGVDPVSREEFWKILHNFRDRGTPILVSTPYMDEARQCDEVTLMNKGNAMVSGSPGDLIGKAEFNVLKVQWQDQEPEIASLQAIPGFIGIQPFGKRYRLYFAKDVIAPEEALRQLKKSGGNLTLGVVDKPSFEDLFIFFMEYADAE